MRPIRKFWQNPACFSAVDGISGKRRREIGILEVPSRIPNGQRTQIGCGVGHGYCGADGASSALLGAVDEALVCGVSFRCQSLVAGNLSSAAAGALFVRSALDDNIACSMQEPVAMTGWRPNSLACSCRRQSRR